MLRRSAVSLCPLRRFAPDVKFIIPITKGIIRDQRARRTAMFALALAALAVLFAGATFLSGRLAAQPLVFLCYWAVCAWLAFSAMLLALYDLLALRAAAQRERKRLGKKIFGDHDSKK